MKFLTRFFTHWTKKKVIICALTALVMAGASFGATKLFGKSGIEQISAPSDTASTKIARPIGETVEEHKNDANYNLYVAQQVLSDFGSFEAVSNGTTHTVVEQAIYARRAVSGESFYKESISYSAFAKPADRRFATGDIYLYRSGVSDKSGNTAEWNASPKALTKSGFDDRYGSVCLGLSPYILRDETIKDSRFVEYHADTGLYEFEYDLVTDVTSGNYATYFMLKEMKMNSGAANYSEIHRVTLNVFMDKDWVVDKIVSNSAYKVPLFGGQECTEDMVETFGNFGAYKTVSDLPEYDYFKDYFDMIPAEDVTEEKTAVNVLSDMFGKYMGDNALNARLAADVNGAKINADITARIDIQNLENLSLAAKVGDKLFISYNDGTVSLSYDELKVKLSVTDLKKLFGGNSGDAAESDGEDGDDLAGSIMSAMTLTESDGACEISIPINLGDTAVNIKIYGTANENGYDFAGADASVGDILTAKVTLTETELPLPTDLSDYADILPEIEKLVADGGVSLKVNTGLDLGGADVVAYVKADFNEKLATINIPDFFGETVALSADKDNIKLTYGSLNAILPLGRIGDLVDIVKANFGDELADLTAKLPDIKDIDFASVVAEIAASEIKKTENGYRFNINLGEDGKDFVVCIGVDGGIKSLAVSYGDIKAVIEGAGDYEFISPDEENAVDLVRLAERAMSTIVPFIKNDGGYAVGVNGLKLTFGDNAYTVNGNVRIDKDLNVSANAVLALNGNAVMTADIVVYGKTLYAEVNGYKFAVNLAKESGENEEKSFDPSALKGYNDYLDEVVGVIENIVKTDFKSVAYGKLIKKFAYDDQSGVITLTVDGGVFGLGDVTLAAGIADNKISVTLAETAISEHVSLAVEKAEVKTDVAAIAEPDATKYVTNFAVKIGDDITAYVKLDVLGGRYDVKAQIGNYIVNAQIVGDEIFVKYRDLVVKAEIGDADEIIAFVNDIFGDKIDLSKTLDKLKTITGGLKVSADADGLIVTADKAKITLAGATLTVDLSAYAIKGVDKISIGVGNDETEFEDDYSSVAFELKDVLPALDPLAAFLNGGNTLVVDATISGMEISAVAGLVTDGENKYLAVKIADLFGAALDAKITEDTAYVAYGAITVKVAFADIGDLVSKIKSFINEIGAAKSETSTGITSVTAEEIINAVVDSLKKTDKDGGYEINAAYNDYAISLVFGKDELSSVKITAGEKLSADVSFGGTVAFVSPDEKNAVDIAELTDKILPTAGKLLKADGYCISVNGLKLTLGDNTYTVNADVTTDKNLNVSAKAELTLNGKAFIKADAVIFGKTLYAEVNGYKFAVNLAKESGENEEKSFDLSVLKGYNDYLDEVVGVIENIVKTDFKSVAYGKLIKKFAYDDQSGVITLTVDGGVFGLGDVTLAAGIADNKISVTLAETAISEHVSLAVENAEAKPNVAEISEPDAKDYVTNFAVKIDDGNVVYAKLDLIGGVFSFDLASDYDGVRSHLYVEYVADERTVYIKCGDTYVKCPIDRIKNITDALTDPAHPERKSGRSEDETETVDVQKSFAIISVVREIVKNLSITVDDDGANVTTSVGDSIKNLLNIGISVDVDENYDTTLSLKVSELGDKTLTVSVKENPNDYADFSQAKDETVDLADVFDDYYPTLVKLTDVSAGVKTWTFGVDELGVKVKGKDYVIGKTSFTLKYSADETIIDVPALTINDKTLALKAAYKKEYNDDGSLNETATRVYLTFNDMTNASSELKFSVSKAVLDKIISEDLSELMNAVPQLKALLFSEKLGLSNLVNLSTLVSKTTYDKSADKTLSVTINGDALVKGLGELTLRVSEPATGSVRLNVTAAGGANAAEKDVVVNGITLSVSADDDAKELSYDVSGHTDLDSLQTLLHSFVKTADRTSFRLVGTIPVKLSGIVGADIQIGVDVKVDIERKKGQSDVVYVAAKLIRNDLSFLARAAFKDMGGESYLFYDNVSNNVTIMRNSYYCKKCKTYKCAIAWHNSWVKDTDRIGNCSYNATVSAEQFKTGMVDYMMEMLNMIDSIRNAITGATSSKQFGIDDVLTGYSYGDSTFALKIALNPIDDVLGDANIYIKHDENDELVSLTGDVRLLDITGVKCTGEFTINLVDAVSGDAKDCVTNKTLY